MVMLHFDVYVGGQFNPTVAGVVNPQRIDNNTQFTYNVANGAEKVKTYLDNGLHIIEFSNGNAYKVEGQSAGQYGNVVLTKYLTKSESSDVVQNEAISAIALNLGAVLSDTDDILNSMIFQNSDYGALNNALLRAERKTKKIQNLEQNIW